jgi:hypothetical protein
MPQLRRKHLPHRVAIVRLVGEGSEGDTWSDPDLDVPAYVEQKRKLIIDRRSTSTTFGTEIFAATFIVLLTEDDIVARGKITVFAGTAREREAEVIDSAFFNYNRRTPNHVEVWAT